VKREVVISAAYGSLLSGGLAILIVVGSRNLAHFDAALVGYTFATLFAVFGRDVPLRDVAAATADRAVLAARLASLLPARARSRTCATGCGGQRADFALNRFILRRGKARWLPTRS
jgi:hypothetical protein